MKPREKIINRRKEKGMTSKMVSELIGITQGGYSHIESGSRNLTVRSQKGLQRCLICTGQNSLRTDSTKRK